MISILSFYLCILSRLSYFSNEKFSIRYKEIFNIKKLKDSIIRLKTLPFDKKITLDCDPSLKEIDSINKILYSDKFSDINQIDENFYYIILANSNYNSIFIIGDKRFNTISVVFRGTYSPKSMRSYLKSSSLNPRRICPGNKKSVLLGVYKIMGEQFYTIIESIQFIQKNFLKNKNYTLLTSGHSLGGAISVYFSYYYVQLTKKKIICITYGAPRIMNKIFCEDYQKLLESGNIVFRRIVTNGDPISEIPPNNLGYHHIDECYIQYDNYSRYCSDFTKTKKNICETKKTRKNKPKLDKKYHGNYLGINYQFAAEGLTNTKKEIVRNEKKETINRIIWNGNKVSFYKSDDLKVLKKNQTFSRRIMKKLTTHYGRQDQFMTEKNFNNIYKDSTKIENDNKNPLKYNKLIDIDQTKERTSISCL